MDLVQDKRADSDERIGLKTCDDCEATTTPLWRSGPGGPKSLCNACGIKYQKRRRQALGMQTAKSSKATKKRTSVVKQQRRNVGGVGVGVGDDWTMRVMALASEIVVQVQDQDENSKMGDDESMVGGSSNMMKEEERAARLLMAMSCGGPVYA